MAEHSTPIRPRSRGVRSGTFLLTSLTGVGLVAALCVPSAAAAEPESCSTSGALIIVGGSFDAEAQHLVGVKQRYTGQKPTVVDGQVVIVDDESSPYAAAPKDVIYVDYPSTVWPLGATGYDASTARGKEATLSAIAGYQERCGTAEKPNPDIVVVGYSQGARVAGDVLADIGNDRNVTDVVATGADGEVMLRDGEPVVVDVVHDGLSGELYADPRRAGDKRGRGIELSLIGVIPGLTMSGPRGNNATDPGFGELNGHIVSVCIDGDPICDLPDPVFDPIGAIDGVLGYFTKHGQYPFQMYRDPRSNWNDGRTVECDDLGNCLVDADSAFGEVVGGWARDLGFTGTIGDILGKRPTLDLPLGIELSNLQPLTRLIQGVLPQLPQLGYGAYLPDLFVFEDILAGIVTLSPARLREGVTALAASVRSIVLLPVNFVRHWAGALTGPPTTSSNPGVVTLVAERPGAETLPETSPAGSALPDVTPHATEAVDDQAPASEAPSDDQSVPEPTPMVEETQSDDEPGDAGESPTVAPVVPGTDPRPTVDVPAPDEDEVTDDDGGQDARQDDDEAEEGSDTGVPVGAPE